MIKRKTIGPAVLLASAVLAASVPEKPNYSGVWMINPQKSQLANWAKYDQTTITIEHKEPIFRFHRASVKAGKTDESDYELTTDGVEKVNKEGRMTEYNRLYWEGDSLVYSSRMVLPDGREATDTVRYTLMPGGKTFVAEEKFRGPVVKYDNLWVADRKAG
ncbi:MAG: hypothetical protein ABSG73_03645 [Candidatus Aminicenantales bacterium]|jgi:hypothetical protein